MHTRLEPLNPADLAIKDPQVKSLVVVLSELRVKSSTLVEFNEEIREVIDTDYSNLYCTCENLLAKIEKELHKDKILHFLDTESGAVLADLHARKKEFEKLQCQNYKPTDKVASRRFLSAAENLLQKGLCDDTLTAEQFDVKRRKLEGEFHEVEKKLDPKSKTCAQKSLKALDEFKKF
jgi:hypothetical protein